MELARPRVLPGLISESPGLLRFHDQISISLSCWPRIQERNCSLGASQFSLENSFSFRQSRADSRGLDQGGTVAMYGTARAQADLLGTCGLQRVLYIRGYLWPPHM